jgi:hypothetical protein
VFQHVITRLKCPSLTGRPVAWVFKMNNIARRAVGGDPGTDERKTSTEETTPLVKKSEAYFLPGKAA